MHLLNVIRRGRYTRDSTSLNKTYLLFWNYTVLHRVEAATFTDLCRITNSTQSLSLPGICRCINTKGGREVFEKESKLVRAQEATGTHTKSHAQMNSDTTSMTIYPREKHTHTLQSWQRNKRPTEQTMEGDEADTYSLMRFLHWDSQINGMHGFIIRLIVEVFSKQLSKLHENTP